jgi:hypothetical protein
MQIIHDLVKILDGIKEALLALGSTILLAITLWQIIREKVKPRK